jgi:lysophospholipase L1-like esterase
VSAPGSIKLRALKIALALALVVVGGLLFQPRSPWLRFGPPLLVALGLLWAASLIFLAGVPEGAARRARFKSAAATVLSLLTVILGSSLIRLGPTQSFEQLNAGLPGGVQAQTFDPELGWAPAGEGLVGQHLERIDPSREHVLLLGDSIVYGWGVGPSEHLGARLQARMPGVQVLNGAVSGWSIDQYYLYLRRIVDQVKPKVVVVGLFTGNDWQITGREFSWGASKPLFVVKDGALQRANEGAGCIDDLGRSLLFRTLWRDRDLALSTIRSLCAPRELRRSEIEAVIARLFVEIEALAARHGAKVLFELMPTRSEHSLYDGDTYLYIDKYLDLRRLLEIGHHAFHEPFPMIARAERLSREPLYLEDNGHFTARGHDLLAADLLEALKTRGLVP